jgi:hypothetical protein
MFRVLDGADYVVGAASWETPSRNMLRSLPSKKEGKAGKLLVKNIQGYL